MQLRSKLVALCDSTLTPLGILGLTFYASCGAAEDTRLSTILITLDTTRADVLSCYGNQKASMPHLDQLAAQSLTYDYAHTVAPLTLPSHASMLTGLYPLRHGVRINGPRPLAEDAWTLAEACQAVGIQTAAFVSASVLNAPLGLAQGFDHFDQVEGQKKSGYEELERPASEVVDAALAWLARRDSSRPFFLWLHFFDPHAPYQPNAEFKGRTGNAYLDELAYVDHHLGRFLQALEDTQPRQRNVVLLAADHGESFGEHDEESHGWLTYEGVLRVPFLLRYPDAHRAGERSNEVISVVDIAPTLGAAMGLSVRTGLDGLSLFHSSAPEERGVYFETYQGYEAQRWSPINGWLNKKGKYIHSSEPEWYDPRLDPKEIHNLVQGIDTTPYLSAIQALGELSRLAISTQEVDQTQMNAIEALGYAGSLNEEGGTPEPLAATGLPAPRSLIKDERILRRAMQLHMRKDFVSARPLLEGILERNPSNLVAAEVLGYGFNSEGKYQQAEAVLSALVQRGTRWPNVLFLLGHALQKQGRLGEARQSYEAALAEDPDWKPALEALAKLP